jgi:predicted transcriptional regulator
VGERPGDGKSPPNHAKVKRARDLKAQGLTPADVGKIIGASRATVYRYLRMDSIEVS